MLKGGKGGVEFSQLVAMAPNLSNDRQLPTTLTAAVVGSLGNEISCRFAYTNDGVQWSAQLVLHPGSQLHLCTINGLTADAECTGEKNATDSFEKETVAVLEERWLSEAGKEQVTGLAIRFEDGRSQ